jgi:hypothetical protein
MAGKNQEFSICMEEILEASTINHHPGGLKPRKK